MLDACLVKENEKVVYQCKMSESRVIYVEMLYACLVKENEKVVYQRQVSESRKRVVDESITCNLNGV